MEYCSQARLSTVSMLEAKPACNTEAQEAMAAAAEHLVTDASRARSNSVVA